MAKSLWFCQRHETKSEPPLTGCNFVDFSRRFSIFELFPGAQLEKSQIIPASFFPLFFSIFIHSLLIPHFPCFLAFLTFHFKLCFLLWKVPKHLPACIFKVRFPHECASTGRSWTNGIIPSPLKCSYFWGRALQPLCLQHVLGSLEREWRITFSPESTFLGKLNITWN